jgi:hypothetical protein
VCSVHFTPDDFEIPLQQQLLNYSVKNIRTLKPTAVPVPPLPDTQTKKRSCDPSNGHAERILKRQRRAVVNKALAEIHSSSSSSREEAEVPDTAIQDVGSENILDGDQPAFNTQEEEKQK